MSELMKRVVDDFGDLVSIAGGTIEPADPASPSRFEQYEFVFERGCLTVSADPDDDTVRLSEVRMKLPHAVQLTELVPWSAPVGSGVRWIWFLQNHNGYQDGIQIEFGPSSGDFSVQLMCMASGVTAARVSELDGQFRRV